MSDPNVRGVAVLDDQDRVVIQPETLTILELRRLAPLDHVVSLQSYLKLKTELRDVRTDLAANRLAFKSVSDRCNSLRSVLDRPGPRIYCLLRKMDEQIRSLDRELAKQMLDLHDLDSNDSSKLYDYCWTVIDRAQNSLDQMDTNFFSEMVEGFKQINL